MLRFTKGRGRMGPRRGRNRIAVALLTIALGVPARAWTATHNVSASGTTLTFSPSELTVQVGDTVVWTAVGAGSHTVTNGTGAVDPSAGNLFDASIGGLNPPSFQFTFNTPGDVPYFCRPHEIFGMTGIVHVQQSSAADPPRLPRATLDAPAPNPFNPRTQLKLSLAVPAHVRVGVFDARGRQIAVLVDGDLPAGERALSWQGQDASGAQVGSGVYLTQMVVDGREEPLGRHRLVLVR